MSPATSLLLSMLPTPAVNDLMAEAAAITQKRRINASPQAFIAHKPHPGPQQAFIEDDETREVLYGGAAGGGKTDGLLMAALKYVHVPNYSAIIFRRTYPQLTLAEGLIPRSMEWLAGKGAVWNGGRSQWTFPSGATLALGHLQYDKDVFNYAGGAYQFIGWDELTQFTKYQYTFLFSRLRKPTLPAEWNPKQGLHLAQVPLRVRAASNPGGLGHQWVKSRFLSQETDHKTRRFIRALIEHNPSLNRAEYEESLAELDHTTRLQLLRGDWDASDDGLISWDMIEQAQTADTLWKDGQPPSGGKRPELYMGVDVGRTNHRFVIWIDEKVGDVFWCREMAVFQGIKFSQMKAEIVKRLSKSVVKCCIDKGGIGYQLAEELETEYPAIVEGVQLTRGRQGQLAKQVQVDFQENKCRIPEDPDLQEDLQLVRKVDIQNGVPVVKTHEGQSGHADRFWAKALARFGCPFQKPKSKSVPRGGSTNHNRKAAA